MTGLDDLDIGALRDLAASRGVVVKPNASKQIIFEAIYREEHEQLRRDIECRAQETSPAAIQPPVVSS